MLCRCTIALRGIEHESLLLVEQKACEIAPTFNRRSSKHRGKRFFTSHATSGGHRNHHVGWRHGPVGPYALSRIGGLNGYPFWPDSPMSDRLLGFEKSDRFLSELVRSRRVARFPRATPFSVAIDASQHKCSISFLNWRART